MLRNIEVGIVLQVNLSNSILSYSKHDNIVYTSMII